MKRTTPTIEILILMILVPVILCQISCTQRNDTEVPSFSSPSATIHVTASPAPTPVITVTPEPAATVAGRTYTLSDDTILLSKLDQATADELDAALDVLSSVSRVDLTACDDCAAYMETLVHSHPDTLFIWNVPIPESTCPSTAESIDLTGVSIESVDIVRSFLPYFPSLNTLILSDTGLENEDLAALQQLYPDIDIIWTVYFCNGKRSLRTDAIAYSTKNTTKVKQTTRQQKMRLQDADAQVLQYCTKLVALDLGHNEISDLSFLSGMQNLQILILADNKITDISVLSGLKKLQYIELFMNRIEDISPLGELPILVDLNLCHNRVSDLSPLYKCKLLDRLWVSNCKIPKKSRAEIQESLPDTDIKFDIPDDTAAGWRKHERYFWMHSYFYPEQFDATPVPNADPPGLRTPSPEN